MKQLPFFLWHGQIIINVVLHSARTSHSTAAQYKKISIKEKRNKKKKPFPQKKIN